MAGFANGPVQVYFTRPSYPERSAGREGGIDETVAADMDRAQRSIDIAVFDLDLPKVGAALIRAQQRGLRVRAVIDGENLEAPEVAALAGEMQQAGVPITFDRRSAFMHNKFVVLDDAVVWTGSWNPTINDTFRNDNNFVRIAEDRLAGDYTRKFELLFAGNGGPGNPAPLANPDVEFAGYRVAAAFSPDSDVTGDVVEAIEGARSQIDVLAFSFTSDPIGDALIAAQARGIAVRGVMESRNAGGSGSELEKLQTAGIDVLEDGNCYVMHHKVFVIDNARVITGSFNWSAQAQNSNDENAVIVDNAWFAQRYADEFQRVYDQARNPLRCGS
jgi:phosphatidylserine/phosphatidylglycerophosphate/cardiolipin synthase-like enzyme